MAKRVDKVLKLVVPAGKATPAPPVGSTLGQAGINIGEFCKRFNAETASRGDINLPVVVTVYLDKTFSFEIKTPLTSELIKKAVNIEKGSGEPNRDKVARISMAKLKEIAELKLPDLNARDLDGAIRIVMGTARSMGVEIEGELA